MGAPEERTPVRTGVGGPLTSIEWREDGTAIEADEGGLCLFRDTVDHWRNGVCRLLGVSDAAARRWVERVCSGAKEWQSAFFGDLPIAGKLDVLARASAEVLQDAAKQPARDGALEQQLIAEAEPGPGGLVADMVWASSIPDVQGSAVVGNRELRHGWLTTAGRAGNEPGDSGVRYDAAYFESSEQRQGYDKYRAQRTWRLPKSRRLLRQVEAVRCLLGLEAAKCRTVLDVGSGYGYFRKAVDERGWAHEGLEISEHAIGVCHELFGFDTRQGQVADLAPADDDRHDLVTVWDVLEHAAEPVSFLSGIRRTMKDSGMCAIRTPNLVAFERGVLGRFYHSFKRDHLNYFSPSSLLHFLRESGLHPAFLVTESHLLRGFLMDEMRVLELMHQGSDILMVATRHPVERGF